MPQRAKGPRLYFRAGKGYIIRDTGRPDVSARTSDSREADRALARYIAARDRPAGPAEPGDMSISTALSIYGEEHAPGVAAPARIGYAIAALDRFWGALAVSAITKETCNRYVRVRGKADGTIRRELTTLRAALNYCVAEGRLTRAPAIHMPKAPPGKDRWLTRSEVARLIRAARRSDMGKHLARFILVGVYTGSRKSVILNLRFMPQTAGGWIDTARGVIHRRGEDEIETKKRRPPARLSRKLLAHARRWEANGARHAVEFRGQRVADIKTAWNAAATVAGLEGVTPHTLRHTAATWLMQRGVEPFEAAGFLGMSVETLLRVYGHHHPDHQANAAGAMDRKV